ncbi:MAG: hypothetical protein U0872_06470 [Planctomycetaceae bacterium]
MAGAIDAAFAISHADADHCNGLPALLEAVPVGKVLDRPQVCRQRLSLARRTADLCNRKQIPVVPLIKGERVPLCPDVEIQLFHPPQGFESEKDNPMSLVAGIEYCGRRILLTGDLEGDGLAEVLSQPAWGL